MQYKWSEPIIPNFIPTPKLVMGMKYKCKYNYNTVKILNIWDLDLKVTNMI